MGRNGQRRRAAKAKRGAKRARQDASNHRAQRTSPPPPSDPPITTRELVAGLLDLAVALPRAQGGGPKSIAVRRLCALDAIVVASEIERHVLQLVAAAWNGGWQPTELLRQARRATNATAERLALVAIAADHVLHRAATLDPRWSSQLDQLALARMESAAGWLRSWADHGQVDWADAIELVVALVRCLRSLTPIPILIPPPGARRVPDAPPDWAGRDGRAADPILERVRALLAQAESTTFEAEAETFTAKAQQLMTRHAIDEALVSSRSDSSERPVTIRVSIDDPYADAKALLLQEVAVNSRCRAVSHGRFAMSSVIGFATDVAATEMLFTSLLVQAQAAMRVAAARAPAGARARSRGFRAAFLTAYAIRIGARLAEINDHVITDIDVGGAALPVLAARSATVDASVDELFGTLKFSSVRDDHDPAGWASGRLAADCARLNAGGLRPSRACAVE